MLSRLFDRVMSLPWRHRLTHCIVACLVGAMARVNVTSVASPASQPVPATKPDAQSTLPEDSGPTPRIVPFQPGVRIDWTNRQVEVDATVILRQGPLELFACSRDTREHESIVCIQARPLFVYQAMGLIGMTPGQPLRFELDSGRVTPATGEAVEVDVRYEREGAIQTEPIEGWMRRADDKRPLSRQPWVFAGSIRLDDGGFAADYEGTVVAVVDFEASLVALPQHYSASNEALWLEPNTEAIPPVGTSCTLIFRFGPVPLRLDSTGRIHLGGRRVLLSTAARSLRQCLDENPARRVHVTVDADSPPSDRALLDEMLRQLAIPRDHITRTEAAHAGDMPHDPTALATWLSGRMPPSPDGLANTGGADWADATHHLVDDLRARSHALRQRVEDVTRQFFRTSDNLSHFLSNSTSEPSPPDEPHP